MTREVDVVVDIERQFGVGPLCVINTGTHRPSLSYQVRPVASDADKQRQLIGLVREATGYAGNGLTFGTLAGIMISDAILGRSNPWSELFDPGWKALTRLVGLREGERRLPVLPDSRPVCGSRGEIAACGQTR
jgi:hypothetical protein